MSVAARDERGQDASGWIYKISPKSNRVLFYLFATCCFISHRDTSVFNYAGRLIFMSHLTTRYQFCGQHGHALFVLRSSLSVLFEKHKNNNPVIFCSNFNICLNHDTADEIEIQ